MSDPSSPQELALEEKFERIYTLRDAMGPIALTPDQSRALGSKSRATPMEIAEGTVVKPKQAFLYWKEAFQTFHGDYVNEVWACDMSEEDKAPWNEMAKKDRERFSSEWKAMWNVFDALPDGYIAKMAEKRKRGRK